MLQSFLLFLNVCCSIVVVRVCVFNSSPHTLPYPLWGPNALWGSFTFHPRGNTSNVASKYSKLASEEFVDLRAIGAHSFAGRRTRRTCRKPLSRRGWTLASRLRLGRSPSRPRAPRHVASSLSFNFVRSRVR